MARRKIIIERITVHNNGDRSGKGELYWAVDANSQTLSELPRNDAYKARDGEVITLGDHLTVDGLDDRDTLTVSGYVSEKDGVFSGQDESAKFNHVYSKNDNWGNGSHDVPLSDGPLDVTLRYRIEDL